MKKLAKITLVVLALVITMPIINSCKKGENDPFLSLKSRTARLVGEWNMTSGSQVMTDNNGTETITFNNGSFTWTDGTNTSTGTYVFDMTIEKAGTFTMNQSFTQSGVTWSNAVEGVWYFLGKNKENDVKNKECVAFQATKTTTTGFGSTDFFNETGADPMVFIIDQLKNKEIIITRDYTYSETGWNESDMQKYTYALK
jgi:hypothetical protein